MDLLRRINRGISRLFQNDGFSIMFVFISFYTFDYLPAPGKWDVYITLASSALIVYSTNWLINRYKDNKPPIKSE